MDVADLTITIAYLSIPLQILFSLWQYPRLARPMPIHIVALLILFAFFIFLCGAGHLLRCLDQTHTTAFFWINVFTAVVSLVTALYLLPLIPSLLGSLDDSLQDLVKLNNETVESKSKLISFMAFLCHEIRNPLFAITSSASFLGDTDLTEEQEVGVGSIFDSSLLMLRLVNDVLDLSKIDAGKLELEERDFDFHRLLENLETNIRMQVAQKHGEAVELGFDVAPNVPQIVYGDSIRILQIIYNLLSNSSKFTSQGRIDVSVSVSEDNDQTAATPNDAPDAEDGGDPPAVNRRQGLGRQPSLRSSLPLLRRYSASNECENDNAFATALLDAAEEGGLQGTDTHEAVVLNITVTDTGIGIAPDRVKTIFEPYSQSKLSDYRKHGGTGLGLSILSSLMKLMGGKIEVKSRLGKGSRFALRLPIKVAHDQQAVIEDNTDMSDPFLSCRRLPVYADKDHLHDGDIPAGSADCNDLTTDTAGIKFFSHVVARRRRRSSVKIKPLDQKILLELDAKEEKKVEDRAVAATATTRTKTADNSGEAPKKKKKPKLPSFHLPRRSCVVLVVDDNCVNRKIIGKMLSFFNVEYEEAVNGQEAVDILRRSRNATGDPMAPRFGLVFMDLSMPVLDGYDAIEMVRKDSIEVPIVALTANALSQERKRALDAGADEFHTKPILRNDLHAICTRFLHALSPASTSPPGRPDQKGAEEKGGGTLKDMGESSLGSLGSGSTAPSSSCGESKGESKGDVYREGISLMVRHDSAIPPVSW